MGFMDKLMFWKKKDEFADLGLKGTDLGLGQDLGLGPDTGFDEGIGRRDAGFGQEFQRPMQPQFQQPSPYSYQQPVMPQQPAFQERSNREMEVVSSKLDVLKAKLDSIDQRLANLERMAQGEQESYRKRNSW